MNLVMFSQTTCGPCRQLRPHLEAAAKIAGLVLEIWNVDDNWPLCQKYGVVRTPTVFVMDDDLIVVAKLESTEPGVTPNALNIADELVMITNGNV